MSEETLCNTAGNTELTGSEALDNNRPLGVLCGVFPTNCVVK